ncbi:MAG: hypothetical protein OHK0028_11360 [Deltaproteobacteria bacterium]
MKRSASILLSLSALSGAWAHADGGYRLYESSAAWVNGDVIFRSDIEREACFHRCAAMPGSDGEILSADETRNRLVLDTLALQEQRKLLLGAVDNVTLEGYAREAESRMEACPSSCRRGIGPGETREWIRRKLLIRDFFNRRVAVFVEVKDDDVRRELARRRASAENGGDPTEEQVRDDLTDARVAQEIRNWQSRAASKSRVILSPLEER